MLGKLVLVMMLLCVAVSAETLTIGNYSISFDYNRQHEIRNNDTLQTFDGVVMFWNSYNESRVMGGTDGTYIGETYYNNNICMISISKNQKYYNINTIDNNDVFMTSTMNLTDTIDFLKTLKIEKAKP